MSDRPETPSGPPIDERAIARKLRLRPERPRVTRLSRRVLIGFGAVGSVAVLGATIWALQPSRQPKGGGQELYSTDNKPAADGLANLPRDYTGLPRRVPPLGPPLPGDLGRPIVAAQNAGQPVTVPNMPASLGADPEQQRQVQEREAARLSKLFTTTSGTDVSAPSPPALASGAAPGATIPSLPMSGAAGTTGAVGADLRENGQGAKLAFVDAATDRRTISSDRLETPVSPYVVQAGTLIAGALLTGVRSDLPGQVTA